MPKLLLVEDEVNNADMLSRRLTKRGYDVVIAGNGVEACEMLHREAPDLILMDMQMPVMDGYEATSRIKSDVETKHIPLIGLSAHSMAEHRELALQAGCDDYDTKPIEMTRLLEKIETLLAKFAADQVISFQESTEFDSEARNDRSR